MFSRACGFEAYLRAKSTCVSSAQGPENSTNNDGSNRLVQGKAELRAEDTNWECAHVTSQGPP
jgi:hypothetical protein